MKSGRKFNLDIQTGDDGQNTTPTKTRVTPKRAGGRITPTGADRKTPTGERKTPRAERERISPAGKNGMPSSTYKNRIAPLGSTMNKPQISTTNQQKTPRDTKDFWKTPDGEKSDDSDEYDVIQKVRREADCEVFETDAPDVDFDELNEGEIDHDPKRHHQRANQWDLEQLQNGIDIKTKNVSTQQAYEVFSHIEEAAGSERPADPFFSEEELASHKLERLALELDQLEKDLKDLEKEELPSNLKKDDHSTKEQLRLVTELKQTMHELQSSAQSVQSQQASQPSNLDLKPKLQGILADKRIQSQEQGKTSEESESVELYLKVPKFDTEDDLQKGIQHCFRDIQSEVDQQEKLVGLTVEHMSPVLGKNTDLYSIIKDLEIQIGQAPSSDTVQPEMKDFLAKLGQLQVKFDKMNDIDYDKTRVDQLYVAVERAIEQNSYLHLLLERLKVIDSMHEASPQMQAQIAKIGQQLTTKVPALLKKECDDLVATKAAMKQAVSDIQEVL